MESATGDNSCVASIMRNMSWGADANQPLSAAGQFPLPASAEDTIDSNLVINGNRQPAFDNIGVRQHWNRFLRAVGAYGGFGTSTSISFKGFGGLGASWGRSWEHLGGFVVSFSGSLFSLIFSANKMSCRGVHEK